MARKEEEITWEKEKWKNFKWGDMSLFFRDICAVGLRNALPTTANVYGSSLDSASCKNPVLPVFLGLS